MGQATFSTKPAQPEQAGNGLWRSAFENWVTRNGDSYMSSSCTSAALYDTAADAEEAGMRAVGTVEATGKFPNLCEKW